MNYYFNKIRLVNINTHTSKTVTFKDTNLITSNNGKGKSVLMKSFYHTLGADAAFDDNFEVNEIMFSLDFSYGDNQYKFLRYGNDFVILKNGMFETFIPNGKRLIVSKFFKQEFNTAVFLKNRNDSTEIAPPAYLFIPYYLDQDRSWTDDQDPFSKNSAQQFKKDDKNELYLYHLGLYTSDYAKKKIELEKVKNDKKTNEDKIKDESKRIKEIKELFKFDDIIPSDNPEFNLIYKENTKSFDNVIKNRQEMLDLLSDLNKNKTLCLYTIDKNNELINKLKKENSLPKKYIECPNCKHQFEVNSDEELMKQYRISFIENQNKTLEDKIRQIDEDIKLNKSKLKNIDGDLSKFNETVNNAKAYENYVAYKAYSPILSKLTFNIENYKKIVADDEGNIKNLESYLRTFSRKTSQAKTYFIEKYKYYLDLLEAKKKDNVEITAFKKLNLSGSQYGRSTLALYYAFLRTKDEYNPDYFNFPIVIDSPLERHQDDVNSDKIIKFVLQEDVNGKQRIIASADSEKFINDKTRSDFNLIVLFNENGSFMNKKDYDDNKLEIENDFSYFMKNDWLNS